MLQKQTTIVLGVIAAALLAVILIFDRGTLSTSQLEERSGRALRSFVRDDVTRVELVRGDERPIVLEREPRDEDEEEEGAVETWRIAAPVRAAADQDAVDSLLSALDWLMADRTYENVTAAQRRSFGLEHPRFVLRFHIENQDVVMRVGAEAARGAGVYTAVEGESRAYLVERDFIEAIDHDLGHFRDRALVPNDFYPSDAVSMRLAGEGRPTVVLEKREGVWNVREPVRGWASASAVDGIVRMAREARVARFVAEGARNLERYGLDAPWRDLTMERARGAQGTRRVRLRVGPACGEHAEERYVLASDRGPVVCVLASELSALELDVDRVREERLITASAETIERVEVRAGGRTVELAREGGQWTMGDVHADEAAIAEWLGQLSGSRALAFEPFAEGAHGIGSPSATLTIHRTDADDPTVVQLGESGPDGVWVRRGEEEALVRYDAAITALLDARSLRFRSRNVVGASPGDARAVTVEHDGIEERAVRAAGGDWSLESPIHGEADRVVVRDIARQIAELHAERFVAEEAEAEHGLAEPRATVTVRFEPSEGDEHAEEETHEARTAVLRIGAASAGGAYAQLDGEGPVFEIATPVVDALDTSLASLDALTVETETATSIRLERGDDVVELRRDGTRWLLADGSAPDAERTGQLLERLATLRASGVVAYGPPEPVLGLDRPALRIVVAGATPITIAFGAEQGEGEEAFVPARRSELDVTYLFRSDLVRPILDYTP